MASSSLAAKAFSAERFVDIRYWTPSLLSFTTTRPLALHYLPGQYARIALPGDGRLIWRAFSMVSAPGDALLEFLAVLVPGGLFTSQLAEAQPGDTVAIEHENYGFLTTDRFIDGDELWMLATGTGVGPFLSILRDGAVWKRFRSIVLVRGVREQRDLAYQDELEQHQERARAQSASLMMVNCVSRGQDDPAQLHQINGRITQAWDAGTLEIKSNRRITAAHSRVMLCGNPQMIEDIRARLHARDMKPCRRMVAGQFLTENYW